MFLGESICVGVSSKIVQYVLSTVWQCPCSLPVCFSALNLSFFILYGKTCFEWDVVVSAIQELFSPIHIVYCYYTCFLYIFSLCIKTAYFYVSLLTREGLFSLVHIVYCILLLHVFGDFSIAYKNHLCLCFPFNNVCLSNPSYTCTMHFHHFQQWT